MSKTAMSIRKGPAKPWPACRTHPPRLPVKVVANFPAQDWGRHLESAVDTFDPEYHEIVGCETDTRDVVECTWWCSDVETAKGTVWLLEEYDVEVTGTIEDLSAARPRSEWSFWARTRRTVEGFEFAPMAEMIAEAAGRA